jgi:SAM-dependent methyltransferase
MSQTLATIYENRFRAFEARRNAVWQVLVNYFKRWVKPTDAVIDVGAGYCEFINNIKAAKKVAIDLNPVTVQRAAPGVQVCSLDVTRDWGLGTGTFDVVFSSNFFEHLPSKSALAGCLEQAFRALKPGGKLIAMGPNMRFCENEYWDFWDHFLPLSDRSLSEGLQLLGYELKTIIPQFLPYTMSRRTPPSPFSVRMYLAVPLAWKIMGKQFLVVAEKPKQVN